MRRYTVLKGTRFSQGDQVAYVPRHAQFNVNYPEGGEVEKAFTWDMDHPGVEYGFVMGEASGDTVFCRYWIKGSPGVLRARANSERTPIDCLVPWASVLNGRIWECIQGIEGGVLGE